MKQRGFALLVLMACWSIYGNAVSAAPQKQKPTPQRWEYCVVVSYEGEPQGGGTVAYLPQGRQLAYKGNQSRVGAATTLLNQLGGNGWEVINFVATPQPDGTIYWTLKRRKM